MAKIFRRTWQRQRSGRAGAISSPLPARTGTDGAISGAAFATPVKIFTSATASFVAGDVGRKIRLTGTPSNRYDGLYVIDSINSGTSVNLRFNHNVTGTPTSDARFMENGSSITWYICESCTFTADAVGDIADFYPGSYIFIDSGNSANKGLWLISHRTSSQVVTLSKSYIWWSDDNNPFTVVSVSDGVDFVAESSLTWYVTDRQAMSPGDWFELAVQAFVDAGWSVYQQRGHNTTLNTFRDVVLKSVGETDALIPGGKAMFLRYSLWGARNSAENVASAQGWGTTAAMFQHWDCTLTATAPGKGSGGCRSNANAISGSGSAGAGGGTAFSLSGSGNRPWPTHPFSIMGATSYLEKGRGGLPDNVYYFDYSIFGDMDDMQVFCIQQNQTATVPSLRFGHLKVMGANPNIVTVTNAVTSGTNKDLNTATVDIAALTPPYAVGDNITLIGRKSSSPEEYVETTTIVSFDNTDPSNRLVRVASINMAFGNGPDTLKLQIGEDPFPVYILEGQSVSNTAYLHNLSKLANATGRDYDATNLGSASTQFQIWNGGFAELNPNRKTGKMGLLACGIKNTTNGEFRGRIKYLWELETVKFALGTTLIANSTDAYVIVSAESAGVSGVVGPMSKSMAGIFT